MFVTLRENKKHLYALSNPGVNCNELLVAGTLTFNMLPENTQ